MNWPNLNQFAGVVQTIATRYHAAPLSLLPLDIYYDTESDVLWGVKVLCLYFPLYLTLPISCGHPIARRTGCRMFHLPKHYHAQFIRQANAASRRHHRVPDFAIGNSSRGPFLWGIWAQNGFWGNLKTKRGPNGPQMGPFGLKLCPNEAERLPGPFGSPPGPFWAQF